MIMSTSAADFKIINNIKCNNGEQSFYYIQTLTKM